MTIHPFRRSMFAALVPAIMMVLWGTRDLSAVFSATGPGLLFLAGGVILGAFLSAIPYRLRRRRKKTAPPALRTCVTAFVCGVVLMLGLGLAGTDEVRLVTGGMQSSVSALAFIAVAALAAAPAALWEGRRRE